MSSKKVDRALYGPSWAEVILGAALSFVLGVILAAAVLILRPVQTVRELPKEPGRDVVYYIEGSKDSTKGKPWVRKHQMLNEGTSVTLTEDELNAIFISSVVPDKLKPSAPAEKAKPGAPAAAKAKAPAPVEPAPAVAVANAALLAPGAPNFRLHDNLLQVGVPCALNVYGFKLSVIVMATGGFAKSGDGLVFVPETFYLGSLPVSRLPIVEGFVARKILAAQPVPEDLAADWKKLSDATVDGKTLKLTM